MDNKIDNDIADAILEVPYEFYCGNKPFYLYPASYGKFVIMQRQISQLGINNLHLKTNATLEIVRLVRTKRKECLNIIVMATIFKKEEIFSSPFINQRREFFDNEMSEKDITTLLLYIITTLDRTSDFLKYLGLDKEQERKQNVMRIKADNNKNSIDFGGLSIVGSFILPLIEAGFTYNEIIWERSYVVLRLAIADKLTDVFLSDDEMKKIPRNLLHSKNKTIKADDPKNKDLIRKMNWK